MIPGNTALRHIVVAAALTASFAGTTQGQERPAKRVADIVGVALAEYEKGIDSAGRLISDLEFEEAVAFLTQARDAARRLSGTGADSARQALEATAVDAFKYLAVTRVLALMIAMPLLTIMMDVSGIVGGYVAEAAVSGMSWQQYFERSFAYIGYADIVPATLKTRVFGFLIAVVSSHLGFTTSGGTEGVGAASTRSVVMSSMLVILSDVILVKLIFFFYPQASA